jgi:hypothetical protein
MTEIKLNRAVTEDELKAACEACGLEYVGEIDKALDAELAKIRAACVHQWEEQPGEPARDVCFHCGEERY